MGSGSINAMNATIKFNREQLRDIRNKKRSMKYRSLSGIASTDSYEFPVSKPWVNQLIKDRLQRENRTAAIKLWAIMVLFICVFVFFLLTIL